jgi:hypothetical protein
VSLAVLRLLRGKLRFRLRLWFGLWFRLRLGLWLGLWFRLWLGLRLFGRVGAVAFLIALLIALLFFLVLLCQFCQSSLPAVIAAWPSLFGALAVEELTPVGCGVGHGSSMLEPG